jgi:FixJ family two-component response regulator
MLCDDAVRVLASDVAGRIGRIDCLLLDSQLGQVSGIEVRRQLMASHSAIPVIFMTAHEDETLYRQALEVGFDLRKPLSAHQLLDAIEIARSE